ncbi:unnamed protein product [Paramecium sonneborni]|uniref:Uncharacterized protein n=1 Tax=Paramecium sonneborni TaxID=65129 RepID=A0A8S1RPL5_9CILI|nr:unnamed protein product [Paramecium sonneborni]
MQINNGKNIFQNRKSYQMNIKRSKLKKFELLNEIAKMRKITIRN